MFYVTQYIELKWSDKYGKEKCIYTYTDRDRDNE